MTTTEGIIEDPSTDIRHEISRKSGVVESIEKVFFTKLASAVIDAGRCIQCASCIVVCPSRSLGIAEDDQPTLLKMCTGCSLCWDFCPRGGLRYEKLWAGGEERQDPELGSLTAAFTARAKDPAVGTQDGGVVTALLRQWFKAGEIDGAILARRTANNPLKGEAFIAKSIEDLEQCSGSFYNQILPLEILKDVRKWGLNPKSRLALVGTPCEVAGAKAISKFPWKYRDDGLPLVKYTIALMCTSNFNIGRLISEFKSRGYDLSRAYKIDVKDNILRLYDQDGKILGEDHVKTFRDARLKGCPECADFSGRTADIAIGAVGSAPDHSSVLVRTENGHKGWKLAESAIEYRDIDNIEEIKRIELRNKEIAIKALKRPFGEKLPMKIPFGEHLSMYKDSDKAPVKPAPYRTQHYEISC